MNIVPSIALAGLLTSSPLLTGTPQVSAEPTAQDQSSVSSEALASARPTARSASFRIRIQNVQGGSVDGVISLRTWLEEVNPERDENRCHRKFQIRSGNVKHEKSHWWVTDWHCPDIHGSANIVTKNKANGVRIEWRGVGYFMKGRRSELKGYINNKLAFTVTRR